MARKAISEGGKRDEILAAAIELFLKNGYEGTSIRMILDKVGGEVGMFYHYFSSKQELFDKALEYFMKTQGEFFSKIMEQDLEKISPRARVETLVDNYYLGMNKFEKLANGTVHWSVMYALHDMTVDMMLPYFKTMLAAIYDFAGKDELSEVDWLAPFALKGISGLLHDKIFLSLTKEKQISNIIELLCRTLRISHSIFDE